MENKPRKRDIIQDKESGFRKRIDDLREAYLTAAMQNEYDFMISALMHIMGEIEHLITKKEFKEELKEVRRLYDEFYTLEDKYTVNTPNGKKVNLPRDIKKQLLDKSFRANSIIMKNLHRLNLCD